MNDDPKRYAVINVPRGMTLSSATIAALEAVAGEASLILNPVDDDITIDPRPGREDWRGLTIGQRIADASAASLFDALPKRPLPTGTMTRQQRRRLARKGTA